MARGERVGVLGGTFDPPHVAHLELAEAAREQFDLDRVILVVAGDPWQKRGAVRAPGDERVAMAEAAVAGHPSLEVSRLEVERPGPSYTADTLEELTAPGRELFLVLGADAAAGLPTWHDPGRLKGLATLLVADRPGAPVGAADLAARLRAEGWRCEAVHLPPRDLSSTALRDRLAGGAEVGGDVPAAVVRLVEERGLYTRP